MVTHQNYHKHSHYSNIFTPDSATTMEEYAKRAVELGQGILSSMEHGFQGRYYEVEHLAKKYGLKFIFGTEAYFVKNRHEPDRTNAHICLLAKTEKGRRAINRILSDANIDGYYYKPRIDLDLLLSLPPKDVFVTSACVGGVWKYVDADEIIISLHKHFKENFMLEVQYHNTDSQKILNTRILRLSEQCGIDIIMGCDSHYIYPEQHQGRADVLEAKGIRYEEEEGWYLDYCSSETALKRFIDQGILNESQILRAMENTNILLTFDDITFNKDIKLPTLYPNKTQSEKNQIYKDIIMKEWKEFSKDIPVEKHAFYRQEIIKEVKVIINTGMVDYFLLDYEIVKEAIKMGGIITNTGRGSGVSYFTNTLLGFSKVDRISAPVKLYPERFISESRILETKSLPDLDLNCGNPDIFALAQTKVLGEGHSYPMIAFGTFKKLSAFKLYAKSQKIPFDVANEIAKQIEKYEDDLKYADDDEKDLIDVYDYIDPEYHRIYKGCEKYTGIIASKSPHPCFVKDTMVMTSNGYKMIQEIKEGDFVLTHNNKFEKVLYVMNKVSEYIYELDITGDKLLVTGNHPMYVKTKHVGYEYDENHKRIWVKRYSKPTWKTVDQMTEDDRIGIAINQNSILPIKDSLPVGNIDFWWMIGRYIGDGWTFSRESNGDYRFIICCNKNNNELNEILNKIPKEFKPRFSEERTTYKIYINSKVLHDYVQQFGKYSYGKKLTSDIFDLPTVYLNSFLEGYLSADGHLFKNVIGKIGFTTVSKELAYGLQTCIHKVYNRPCTITLNKEGTDIIEGRKVNRRKKYRGIFKLSTDKKDHNFYEDGYIWIKVKSKNQIIHNDLVYNMEVEKDNSYTVNNFIAHNCGHLIYQGNIKEELGLMLVKSESTKKETLVTVIDGGIAEEYKFLKNDLLKVDVVLLVDKIYKRIGKTPHTVNELLNIIKNDKKVWDIYADGLTIGVNQVEKESTTNKAKRYKPSNVSELTAFIAGIRPSFKSMYSTFESREPFSYGIASFDDIIKTEEMPNSFVLYQEQTMATLAYAGFHSDETYGIIKAISKKKPAVVKPLEERFIKGFSEKILEREKVTYEEAMEMSERVWQIIEDSAGYGFNASHAYSYALDSLYCAYLKAYYPFEFYETMLQTYSDKGNKKKVSKFKREMDVGLGIVLGELKFGKDNRGFVSEPENNTINESMLSVKYLNQQCSEDLYVLGQNKYESFTDLLGDISEKTCLNSRQLDILIKLNYFCEFGYNKKLLDFLKWFDILYSAKTIKKDKYADDKVIMELLTEHSKQTDKQFKDIDTKSILNKIWDTIENKKIKLSEQAKFEVEYLGYMQVKEPQISQDYYIVSEIKLGKNKLRPFLTLHNVKEGKDVLMRIKDDKLFAERKFKEFDVLKVTKTEEERKSKKINGKYVTTNEKELVLYNYFVV